MHEKVINTEIEKDYNSKFLCQANISEKLNDFVADPRKIFFGRIFRLETSPFNLPLISLTLYFSHFQKY